MASDILKWGLIAGGAYLLWNAYTNSQAAAAAPAPGAPPPPPAPGAPPTPPAAPSTLLTTDSQATQQSKILSAAGVPATQLYTVSQWNYEFTKVYGKQPGALGDEGSPMLIGAYLNLMHQNGLSGYGLGARRIFLPTVVAGGRVIRPADIGLHMQSVIRRAR